MWILKLLEELDGSLLSCSIYYLDQESRGHMISKKLLTT